MQNATDEFRRAGIDAKGFFPSLFDFGFTSFIATKVIKLLYILYMILIALFWIVAVIGGFIQGAASGLLALVIGSLFALLLLIFVRIYLELIMVFFRIADNTSHMAAIARTTAEAAGQTLPPQTQQLYPN